MAFSNKVEDQAPKSTRREIHHIYDDDDDEYQTKQDSTTIVEKEHMFDKVVTPSDVGKLNRLVIPKQHAEKYFPLDVGASSSIPTSETSAAKGILLNFEDSTGKPWRFRYSYWNSSQSYVMTKGWSRFVKDKRLDAGDTVSFGRYKDKLFIDWKHRPQITRPPNTIHSSSSSSVHSNFPVLSFSPYGQNLGYNVGGHGNNYVVFRSTVAAEGVGMPVVLESVPVVAQHREVGANSAKRVRLFGVNLDVPEGSSSSASPRGEEKEELSLDLDIRVWI